LVVALQQVVSRNNDPFSPSVLSICSFQGGHNTNVIPSEVNLKGTFSAMDEAWRFEAHKRITEIVENLAKANRAEIELKIDIGYPTVYNNPALCNHARILGEEFIGTSNVEETELRMGAEDFGYYSQKIPGCFFRLGTGNKQMGITSGVHTPRFDIDERAIEIGIGIMAFIGATK
jgi:hippurate hydrolase